MRFLILLHRYLGIAIGLVMAMWCLSGIVMMYVGYPRLDDNSRLAALEPIRFDQCCAYDKIGSVLGVEVADSFRIEMIAGRPILGLDYANGATKAIDLRSGALIAKFDAAQAGAIAARMLGAQASKIETVDRDQWTVSGEFNRDRPLYRARFDDGTDAYVSSTRGTVVQLTTRAQRFWNWLGAVPHWLYPTILRQHARAWTQAVVWLSLAGMFLTVVGLYIGVSHWLAMPRARWSPFRGVQLWHHVSGLFFGVLTLAWVGSGWASMSPWGLFSGGDFRDEREQIRDVWIDGTQIVATLKKLVAHPPSATRIESAPFDGKLYLLVYDGLKTQRVDAVTLASTPLRKPDIERVAPKIATANAFDISFLAEGDRYYYQGHDPVRLPVYRIALNDRERTRYYLDAISGELLSKVDSGQRQYRWLFEAPHRWDFSATLRKRPWWDLVVVPLMLGVTCVCLTGAWLAWKRITPIKRRAPPP